MSDKKGSEAIRQAAFAVVTTLIGALAGITYQQYWNVNLAQMKRFDEWRRDAYVRYLNALEKERLASSKKKDADDPGLTDARREELRGQASKLQDEWEYEKGTATFTLAVFGESEVIRALAEHWRRTEKTKDCEGDGWKTNLAFYKALREKAMGDDSKLSDPDLAELTIRCKPQW